MCVFFMNYAAAHGLLQRQLRLAFAERKKHCQTTISSRRRRMQRTEQQLANELVLATIVIVAVAMPVVAAVALTPKPVRQLLSFLLLKFIYFSHFICLFPHVPQLTLLDIFYLFFSLGHLTYVKRSYIFARVEIERVSDGNNKTSSQLSAIDGAFINDMHVCVCVCQMAYKRSLSERNLFCVADSSKAAAILQFTSRLISFIFFANSWR